MHESVNFLSIYLNLLLNLFIEFLILVIVFLSSRNFIWFFKNKIQFIWSNSPSFYFLHLCLYFLERISLAILNLFLIITIARSSVDFFLCIFFPLTFDQFSKLSLTLYIVDNILWPAGFNPRDARLIYHLKTSRYNSH